MEPKPGFDVGVDYLPIRYLGLGVLLRASWYRGKSEVDSWDSAWIERSSSIDLNLKPTARYPFAAIPLELHLALPIGLAIQQPPPGAKAKPGLALALSCGATYFVSERVGIDLELGYYWRWYKAESQADLSVKMGQVFLALHAVFAFGGLKVVE